MVEPDFLGFDTRGTALGGVIVDGGRFDWTSTDKLPTLTEPYAGYHGIVFAEEFGPSALGMRARAEGLRDFGSCMSTAGAMPVHPDLVAASKDNLPAAAAIMAAWGHAKPAHVGLNPTPRLWMLGGCPLLIRPEPPLDTRPGQRISGRGA